MMISLNNYIQEKLVVNKNYKSYTTCPTTWKELRQIIEDRFEEQGPGIKHKPINFNDIDVSGMTTFYSGGNNGIGLFQEKQFEYIDVSKWNGTINWTEVKNAGIDLVSTANNHSLDTGYSGIESTIDFLDQTEIMHTGTYKSQEERDTIFIKDVKGVKIAFIDYTYGTNGIPVPSGKEFCVNLIDKDLIKKDIDAAKEQNVDMIVACMHWGDEYKTKANAEQENLADFLFKNGVNVIIGNHPHVLEQMEKRTVTLDDGSTQDGFVIYACGNFICDQNAENTRNSIILNLNITRHTDGKISIDKASYIPIYMYKGASGKLKRMKVLDIEKSISDYEKDIDKTIGSSTYNDLKVQLEKIKKIVGPEIN